jgi:hypothetical protein
MGNKKLSIADDRAEGFEGLTKGGVDIHFGLCFVR